MEIQILIKINRIISIEESAYTLKINEYAASFMAGAEGLEPSARGFGDHCSTN